MTTTDTPRRTTGQRAKDSGGGMIDIGRIPARLFVMPKPEYTVMGFYIYRGGVKIGERLTLNIPPDDYARQKEIEVAKPRDNPIGTTLFNQCKPRCWGYGDRYIAWSRLNSPSHLVPPAGDYARHWGLEGPR